MAYIGLKQLDPILTGSLQVSGSTGVTGSLSVRAGDKIFTGANENEYIQTDTTDRMRFVVGGNQMLLLDEDDSRVNVGYGMKLGVGLGNNTTPGVELEVDGHISASSNITGSDIHAAGALSVGDTLKVEEAQSRLKTVLVNPDAEAAGDFRVKSVNLNHVLYTDANKDRVGIAWNNPAGSELLSSLHIDGDATLTHITASGNVSASGTVYASNFESAGSAGEIISFNDNLNITGNITSSGDINTTAGRVYEAGTSVIDHATAMAIVFGG